MTTNVDTRIVQMQFDNKDFERNLSTTMSSLDKFKNSFDFSGTSKGLDNLSKQVGNFNMDSISSAVSTANSRFSAFEIASITVISNITTKIENMAEKLVSAVTIDPVKTGWTEYEQKMDAIKTILNSAKNADGTAVTLDQVKEKIEELNVYADKTIYSFSDMTQNIGKFTNAGVDLDSAVAAIEGVSNAAAASGANANQASHAMYNFAQALSVGYVQRIDWKSIENANMATVDFKQTLLDTAEALGTVQKNADGTYQTLTTNEKGKTSAAVSAAAMFTETLSYKWLTNDVLIDTLNQYSDTTTEIGAKAQQAATEVTTVTKLFETLGEALQSGWSASWEKIIGDYDQAKETLTDINNFLSGMINDADNARVEYLDTIMNHDGEVASVDETAWTQFKTENKESVWRQYMAVVQKVAKQNGINISQMIKDEGTFSATLKNGWFTQDIVDDVNEYIQNMDETKKKNGKVVESFKELKSIVSQAMQEQSSLGVLYNSFDTSTSIDENAWNIFKSTTDSSTYKEYLNIVKSVAKQHGVAIDQMIKDEGSFADTLKNGWFTSDIAKDVNSYISSTKTVTSSYKELKKVAEDVINGAYGSGEERQKKLTKAGYDYAAVQNIINHELNGTKLDMDLINKSSSKTTSSVSSDLKELYSNASVATGTLGELYDTLEEKPSGRTLIIESFTNFFTQFMKLGSAVKQAWNDAFPKATTEQVYNFIDKIHSLSENFKIADNDVFNFQMTFEGLFTILGFAKDVLVSLGKVVTFIIGKSTGLISIFLSVTGFIGKGIVFIRSWIDLVKNVGVFIANIAGNIGDLGSRLKNLKIKEFLLDKLDDIKKKYDEIVTAVEDSGLFKMIHDLWDKDLKWITDYIKKLDIKGNIVTWVEKLKDKIDKIVDAIKNLPFRKFILDKVDKLKNLLDEVLDAGDGVKGVFENIYDYMSNMFKDIPGLSEFIDNLKSIKDTIKTIVSTKISDLWGMFSSFISGGDENQTTTSSSSQNGLASTVDDTAEKYGAQGFSIDFNSAKKGLKNFGSSALSVFKTVISHAAITANTALTVVKNFLNNAKESGFAKAVKDEFDSIVAYIKGIDFPKNIDDLKQRITDLFEVLDEKFPLVKDVIDGVVTSLDTIKDKIDTIIGYFGDLFSGFVNKDSADSAESTITDFTDTTSEQSDKLPGIGDKFKTGFTELAQKIEDGMGKLDLKKLAGYATFFALFDLILNLDNLTGSLATVVTKIGKIITPLSDTMGGLAKMINSYARQMQSETILNIAKAIAIVAASMYLLSKVPTDTLSSVTVCLGAILLVIKHFFSGITMIDSTIGTASASLEVGIANVINSLKIAVTNVKWIAAFGAFAIGFGAAIALLIHAFVEAQKIEFDSNAVLGIIAAVALTVISMIGLLSVSSQLKEGQLDGVGKTMISFAASMVIMSFAIDLMAKSLKKNEGYAVGAIFVLGAFVAGMVYLTKVLSESGQFQLGANNLMTMSKALLLLSIPLALLANQDPLKVAVSAASIAGLAVALGLVTKMLTSANVSEATATVFVAVAGGITALALGLYVLSNADSDGLKRAGIALGVVTVALLALSVVLALLPGLQPAMYALSAVFLGFGVAAAGLGVAVLGIGVGLSYLVDAINNVGPAIVNLVETFNENVGTFVEFFALAISGVITVILANRVRLALAGSSLFSSLITAIAGNLPSLIALGATALLLLIGGIETVFPDAINKLISLVLTGIYTIADAIVNNMGPLETALVYLVKSLLASLIIGALDLIIDLIGAFVPGIADDVKASVNQVIKDTWGVGDSESTREAEKAAEDAAKDQSEAYKKGLEEGSESIESTLPEGSVLVASTDMTGVLAQNIEDGTKTAVEEGTEAGVESADVSDATDSYASKVLDMVGESDLSTSLESVMSGTGSDAVYALVEGMSDSSIDLTSFSDNFGSVLTTSMESSADESVYDTEKYLNAMEIDATPTVKTTAKTTAKTETKKTTQKVEVKTEVTEDTKATSKSAGSTIIKKVEEGASGKMTELKNKISSILNTSAKRSKTDEVKSNFVSSGKFCVSGLIEGLTSASSLQRAYDAGKKIALKTHQGYKDNVKEGSPAKVFIQSGKYAVQGLVLGMNAMALNAQHAGEDLGDVVTSSTSGALGDMSAMLASDIDATPTISPVLDLSQVEKGVGSMDRLFGNSSYSVAASASTGFNTNRSNQNRTTISDVVDAVNKLSGSVSGGNTYVVNGVTYDDGHNITSAVEQLVKYAMMEGRL